MKSESSDSEGECHIDIDDCTEVIDLNGQNPNDVEFQTLQDNIEDIDIDEDTNNVSDNCRDAEFIFQKHVKPIFNIDICIKHNLIITGGEDDIAYICHFFNKNLSNHVTSNITSILPIMGHTDSVIFSKFNHEGDYVATADMSGKIFIYEVKEILAQITDHLTKNAQNKVIQLNSPYSFQETSDLCWAEWHPKFNKVIIAGMEEGDVYIIKFEKSTINQCKILPHGQNQKASTGKILSANLLAVGYGNGDIKIWNMRTEMCHVAISNLIYSKNLTDVPDKNRPYHKTEITCIDLYQDKVNLDANTKQLIIAGSVDGEIKLFDVKDGKYLADFNNTDSNCIINSIGDKIDNLQNVSIETLLFNPLNKDLFFAANLNGNIYIWDFTKRRIRQTFTSGSGIVKALWSNKDPNTILSAHLDGTLKIWNSSSGSLIKSCQIHHDAILDFVLSKDESYLATASEDTTAKLILTKDIL